VQRGTYEEDWGASITPRSEPRRQMGNEKENSAHLGMQSPWGRLTMKRGARGECLVWENFGSGRLRLNVAVTIRGRGNQNSANEEFGSSDVDSRKDLQE